MNAEGTQQSAGAEMTQEPASTPKKPEPARPIPERRKRRTRTPFAIGALVIVAAGAALWWFLIRDDDPSGTTAQGSVSDNEPGDVGGVEIVQIPSLAATATIDGVPADGPIDFTFGEESELVVTVVNDGNLTMDDITVTLEVTADDTDSSGTDPCTLPQLAPEESADCTLEFTPTDATTAVAAKILGYGPQEQEVEQSVDITFG